MADEQKRRSDEELFAAIRKTQEEMRVPDGIDTAEIAAKAVVRYWQSRELVIPLMDNLITLSHSDEPRKTRKAVRKSLKETVDTEKHIKECVKCNELFSGIIRELQELVVQN